MSDAPKETCCAGKEEVHDEKKAECCTGEEEKCCKDKCGEKCECKDCKCAGHEHAQKPTEIPAAE